MYSNSKNKMQDDPTKIEQQLRNLKDLSGVRSFFQELGYEYLDTPIPTRNFKPELTERIEVNSLRQIAHYKDFPIVYCEVKTKGTQYRERQRIKTERLLLRAVPAQFIECLLVTYDSKTKLWHFVNSKPFGNKLRLRRFTVGANEKLRTASERLSLLKVDTDDDWATLLSKHEQAFDREKVSDAFFEEYRRIFKSRKQEIADQIGDEHIAHNFLQLFLNRLMFIYFIQRKGWLGSNGNKEFVKWLWQTYQAGSYPENSFYETWLSPLFFSALNNKRGYKRKGLPVEVEQAFDDAPFLNGGLFREHDGIDDLNIRVTDELFAEVFENILDRYNFTVQEDTPFDQSVSVDPEMLGVVYEKLVNVTDTRNEQASSGIFYTPRVEVDFMCRRSLLEFLAKHTDVSRKTLYQLLFTEETDPVPQLNKDDAKSLWKPIRKMTVVDPACGSGAFLVGMMQVILDIERRLAEVEGKRLDEFIEKKRIIERSLYGVDVKDWAIGVAQLRLWLSLIVEADEKKLDLVAMKIANEALLPSLAFKIRKGDTLVQEIADKPFPIRGHAIELDQSVKAKITELRRLKTDFFFNRGDITERELHRKERLVYVSILDKEIKKLEQERSLLKIPGKKMFQGMLFKAASGKQVDMSIVKEEEQRVAKRLSEIESRLEELKTQRADLRNAKHLFWGIEFAEIFYGNGNDGFDIVIGNPPYVRQEAIANPRQENATKEEKRSYKTKLLKAAQLDWPERPLTIGGQADLYVYFYLRGLALLNSNGVFCFITSNSWLDVAYGKDLQEFLVTRAPIYAIYDNQAKRSFKHADVNTIITLFGAPGKPNSYLSHTARFVMFRKPFEETITIENLLTIERTDKVTSDDNLRVFPIVQKKLWEDGLQQDEADKKNRTRLNKEWSAPYVGNKWGGKYLRAPDIYWKILEKGKGKLVRLGDIAEVRFGIKTGANEFFYLDQKKIDEWGIEEEFLKPVIKSPRECKGFVIDPKDLKYKIFMCHKTKEQLKGTVALKYIKWGETQGFHKRPSCAGRKNWWDLGKRRYPPIISPSSISEIYRTFRNDGIYIDKRLYEIYPKDNIDCVLLATSTILCTLFLELGSRTGLGEGLIDLTVYELADCPVIVLDNNTLVKSVLEDASNRMLLPIDEEITNPNRKDIDNIAFDAIGLTSQERNAVYDAVTELVRVRLNKSKSVRE